jgi:ABC-type transport system involved in cytochrome bd biosynthesis fused ATPase/permease subunit
MTGVGFTYPGTDRQVLKDVNVRCNLNSRVAVLGVSDVTHLQPWHLQPSNLE